MKSNFTGHPGNVNSTVAMKQGEKRDEHMSFVLLHAPLHGYYWEVDIHIWSRTDPTLHGIHPRYADANGK